jgi:hypothetical protein
VRFSPLRVSKNSILATYKCQLKRVTSLSPDAALVFIELLRLAG